MRQYLLWLLGAAVALVSPLAAQATGGATNARLDMAMIYAPTLSNSTYGRNFWSQGGSLQLHGQFYRGLGVVADVSGSHIGNVGSTGVGLDVVTTTFGPRCTLQLPRHGFSFFGETLVGEANGFHSTFPGPNAATDDAGSLALLTGGGLNARGNDHISVRVLDAHWLRTQLPNGTSNVQNNFRVGAGLVFVFH
jgi:hypothetical protein